MFKKICLVVIIILLGVYAVEAKEIVQVEISLSKSEVEVGDTFQVSVVLKNANTGGLNIGNITVPGLQNFQQISSSQSTQVQIINKTTTAVTETLLTFKALELGDYSIGPIETKSANLSFKSNTENIKVIEKKKKSFFADTEKSDEKSSTSLRKNNSKSGNLGDVMGNFLAFTLLCVLIFALYKQKQYKKERGVKVKKEEVRQQIGKQELPSKEDSDFFIKIKKILISYIQIRYKLKIEALTSQEVVKQLKLKKIYDKEKLERALNLCDRGSFSFDEAGKEELINIVKLLK